VLIIVKK